MFVPRKPLTFVKDLHHYLQFFLNCFGLELVECKGIANGISAEEIFALNMTIELLLQLAKQLLDTQEVVVLDSRFLSCQLSQK